MTASWRRVIRWVLPLLLLVAVGAGSFWGVRALRGEDEAATAKPRPDFWYVPYFEADAKKPRFDQEINGILIGPTAPELTSDLCGQPGVTPEYVAPEMAKGTVVDFESAYLPGGVTLRSSAGAVEVVSCGGTIAGVEKRFDVAGRSDPANPSVPLWAGGEITVSRFLTRSRAVQLDEANERMQAATIGGKPAVIVRPVMPDGVDIGIGEAYVVVADDSGMTVISGRGLPLDEFLKFAEGLYKGASQ
jgi:hypothetical protein